MTTIAVESTNRMIIWKKSMLKGQEQEVGRELQQVKAASAWEALSVKPFHDFQSSLSSLVVAVKMQSLPTHAHAAFKHLSAVHLQRGWCLQAFFPFRVHSSSSRSPTLLSLLSSSSPTASSTSLSTAAPAR